VARDKTPERLEKYYKKGKEDDGKQTDRKNRPVALKDCGFVGRKTSKTKIQCVKHERKERIRSSAFRRKRVNTDSRMRKTFEMKRTKAK